jgi:dCTP deaminase
MAFWSGETLLNQLPHLISPFDPGKVDCSAYTLRVGSEVYVSPSESEQDPKKITIQKLDDGDSFTIPPGQFAFLLTEEKITVPRGAMAFISMKTGFKLRGLVNVSGFHVDPGYSGYLIFGVFNAGPKTVHLRRGEDCFLIWYADLDNPHSQMTKQPTGGFKSITTDIVTRISGEVMSFEGLNAKIKDLKQDHEERINKIEHDNGIIKTIAWAILGILVTAAIVPFAKTAWESWISPFGGITPPPAAIKPPVTPASPPSSQPPAGVKPSDAPLNEPPPT